MFKNAYLEDLYQGKEKGKPIYNPTIIKKFKQKIQILLQVDNVSEIYNFKSLHFEKLSNGLHSIRIDKKYRLEFSIEKDEIYFIDILMIEELSNHYGD